MAGNNFTILFTQFLKSDSVSGEVNIIKNIHNITYKSFGNGKFLTKSTISNIDRDMAIRGSEF